MTENDIGYKVRGACFSVYNELGAGLLESAYERALVYEIRSLGCRVEIQVMSYELRVMGYGLWVMG